MKIAVHHSGPRLMNPDIVSCKRLIAPRLSAPWLPCSCSRTAENHLVSLVSNICRALSFMIYLRFNFANFKFCLIPFASDITFGRLLL